MLSGTFLAVISPEGWLDPEAHESDLRGSRGVAVAGGLLIFMGVANFRNTARPSKPACTHPACRAAMEAFRALPQYYFWRGAVRCPATQGRHLYKVITDMFNSCQRLMLAGCRWQPSWRRGRGSQGRLQERRRRTDNLRQAQRPRSDPAAQMK